MSFHSTRLYLERLFPGRLGLTQEEVDFHTQGMAYAIEPQDGIYLIADVAEFIESSMNSGKVKRNKQEIIASYTQRLKRLWTKSDIYATHVA
ncbi:MAG: hypothetical protein PHE67_00240 [Campylobacterales bacterium]|nr:hypothetical protein [Campylobacterales bacterium]